MINNLLDKNVIYILNNFISEELRIYIMENIITIYNSFDNAHNIKHALTVINSSILLARNYNVNYSMVFTIAAFHDIGLKVDRKNHHINSKHILLNDIFLKDYFSQDELIIMANACEDHRASNLEIPRTLYGLIVSDADRTTNIVDMITRCYDYTLNYYNDLTKEKTYSIVYSHLKDKYGENGYVKFHLKESQKIIMQPILEAQEILKNELKFKEIYNKVIY